MSITIAKYDEFINYQGYDKEEALCATQNQNKANDKLPHWQEKWYAETRAFDLPDDKRWEDLAYDEQCDIICNGCDIID